MGRLSLIQSINSSQRVVCPLVTDFRLKNLHWRSLLKNAGQLQKMDRPTACFPANKKLSLPPHLFSDVLNIVSLYLAAPRLRNLQACCKGLLHCFSAQRIVFSCLLSVIWAGAVGVILELAAVAGRVDRSLLTSPCIALFFMLNGKHLYHSRFLLPPPSLHGFPEGYHSAFLYLIPFQLSQLASICQFSFNPWLTLMHESNRTKTEMSSFF